VDGKVNLNTNIKADFTDGILKFVEKIPTELILYALGFICITVIAIVTVPAYLKYKQVDNDSKRKWSNEAKKLSLSLEKQRKRNAKKKQKNKGQGKEIK
jgi:hypothetical protein